MQRTFILMLWLGLSLSACAPATNSSQPGAVALPQLAAELVALPGATLSAETPPVISYPEELLFGPGAVMPLVGSQAILDPLAEMLKSQPGWRWEATVRAVTSYGDGYDQQLAEGRARLLEKYLTARGVASATLEFKALAGAGNPFALRAVAGQEVSPASSSAVKE